MPSATAQLSSGAHRTHTYRRRTPERSVLYRLVQEHLATWLALRDEDPGCQVPAHIERELHTYLECSILPHGFARPYCDACGHDFLIAFSCKGRGICPSCTTQRMSFTAARPPPSILRPPCA